MVFVSATCCHHMQVQPVPPRSKVGSRSTLEYSRFTHLFKQQKPMTMEINSFYVFSLVSHLLLVKMAHMSGVRTDQCS